MVFLSCERLNPRAGEDFGASWSTGEDQCKRGGGTYEVWFPVLHHFEHQSILRLRHELRC
jgi:hypothetical protein